MVFARLQQDDVLYLFSLEAMSDVEPRYCTGLRRKRSPGRQSFAVHLPQENRTCLLLQISLVIRLEPFTFVPHLLNGIIVIVDIAYRLVLPSLPRRDPFT
jgi:hypothetical protein